MIKLHAVDERILDAAQIIADAIHGSTGLNSIHQSRILSALLAAGWLALVIQTSMAGKGFDWIASICVFSAISSAFFGGSDLAAKPGMRNYKRVNPVRMFFRLAGAAVFPVVAITCIIAMKLEILPLLAPVAWASWVWEALDVQYPRPKRIRSLVLQPIREN